MPDENSNGGADIADLQWPTFPTRHRVNYVIIFIDDVNFLYVFVLLVPFMRVERTQVSKISYSFYGIFKAKARRRSVWILIEYYTVNKYCNCVRLVARKRWPAAGQQLIIVKFSIFRDFYLSRAMEMQP